MTLVMKRLPKSPTSEAKGSSPCLRVSVVKIGFRESSSLHRNKEDADMSKHTKVEKEIGTRCRENSLMRHGRTKDRRGPSSPARSPGSFAVGQDDSMSRNMSRYPMVLKD